MPRHDIPRIERYRDDPAAYFRAQQRQGQRLYLTDLQLRQVIRLQEEAQDEGISLPPPYPPPYRWYHYALFVLLGFLAIFALCAMGRPGA